MPYTIKKNRNKNTYKVTLANTGRILAYATKNPVKLMQAIEINKHKRSGHKRSGHKRSGHKRSKTRKLTLKRKHRGGNNDISEEEKQELKDSFERITRELNTTILNYGNRQDIFDLIIKLYDFILNNFYNLFQVIDNFENALIGHMKMIDQWVTVFIKNPDNKNKYNNYNLRLRKLVNESKGSKGEAQPFATMQE